MNSMPSCSERSVISLLYYISCQLTQNNPSGHVNSIHKELESLKIRMNSEEKSLSNIRNSVKELSVYIQNQNWEEALKLLRKLFKEICPLNIHDLFRFIRKVDDAADVIKNKDIILLLGNTGAGKSTTLHFLAGSKMIATRIKGLNHIMAASWKNPDLRNVTTSPSAKSETRFIIPISVDLSGVVASRSDSIIICDTPGFDDTNGPEVDIANGISIIRAIRECKSVRPVVLVSYKGIGDRFEGLKNLTHLLAGLIPKIKNEIRAFSYIFTKYPENEKDTIHQSLINISETMNEQEKSDISFMNLFDDMLLKTKRQTLVLDPVKDEPKEFLYELLRSTAIEDPKEVFQFSITDKSKNIVNNQIRLYQLRILSAIQRYEYSVIKYYLDQIKYLNSLLNQVNIEQIYLSCVASLSKHLSDEYEKGTLMLDRCLIDQNILTVNDIKQYQTYIDHANQAEQLRNDHFDETVLHSGAFIQYLFRLMKKIEDELKEKAIDDPSVKNSFDKIGLVVKNFPDFSNEYRSVQKLFTEKIQTEIDLFKEFISKDQFQGGVISMTKLSSAVNILHEHFSDGYIEEKYRLLKEYLLDNLTHSVNGLQLIFQKPKFDELDIGQINTCLDKLDKALQTIDIEKHISKNEIKELRQSVVSTIVTLFKRLVEETENEFKKEDGWQHLGNLLQQLYLIQTIPSVIPETSQIYYATLGKVIESITALRRDVQDLLSKLIHERQKINYEKLVQHLMNLRSISWIEKYREGFYASVTKNVEQLIVQHVDELKRSIVSINLDLEHSHKMESISEMLHQINTMKHFKDFVSSISEPIQEANDHVIKVVNQVFDTIEKTFDLKKLKDSEITTIDSTKAEKAFKYFDACNNLSFLLKRNYIQISANLENFIRIYSINVLQKEMNTSFEVIKISQNSSEIIENVCLLAARLHEISEINTNCPRVSSHFFQKKLMQDWQTNLSSYHVDLSTQMQQLSFTQSTGELNTKLSTVRALSKLDKFLENVRFIDLYNTYQTVFFTQNTDLGQQVTEAIARFEYPRVAQIMSSLESTAVGQHLCREATRILNTSIKQLIEETQDLATILGSEISETEVRPIVDNLRKMERAKLSVDKYLDESNKINECIEVVKMIIEEGMKRNIGRVKVLTKNHNFSDADKKTQTIRRVRNCLGTYCTNEITEQIKKLDEVRSTVISTDILGRYRKLNIREYSSYPPKDIFQQFAQVDQANSAYTETLDELREIINKKFLDELESAKSKLLPVLENSHIRNYEFALSYVPDSMRAGLDVSLTHYKADIERNIQDNEEKLTGACRSEDAQYIKSILLDYQASQESAIFANRVKGAVLKQIEDIIKNFNEKFDQDRIREAFSDVRKLYNYKKELAELISDIDRQFLKVRKRLIDTFDDVYQFFLGQFSTSNTANNEQNDILPIKRRFFCMTEFMILKFDHSQDTIITLIFPEDFSSRIQVLISKFENYSKEFEEKLQEALENVNIDSLVKILKTMSIWESLWGELRVSYDRYINRDSSMKSLTASIYPLTRYSQFLQAVSQKIENLKKEILNLDLLNYNTREFSTARDFFYRELNRKYLLFNRARDLQQFKILNDIDQWQRDCFNSLDSKIRTLASGCEKLLDQFLREDRLSNVEYQKFNLYYSNLISIRQELVVSGLDLQQGIESIQTTILGKVESWEYLISCSSNPEDLAVNLIKLKEIAKNMLSFREIINGKIDEKLKNYKSMYNIKTFALLGTILNHDQSGFGRMIISEHKIFQGFSLSLFNQKINRHGIKYVLEAIKGNDVDINELRERYNTFLEIYKKIVAENLRPNMQLDQLISDTKFITGNLRDSSNTVIWSSAVRKQIPKLTAHIFALWTLSQAEHYFEAEDLNDRNNYLVQPHAAQVVSVFRLLGIGDRNEELANHLVQIGTGEGKSIVLAVTSIILAILGYDVNCACFSEYLCQRDYSAFFSLFNILDTHQYIHYGTFNKLCEDMINAKGDIRHLVEIFISNNKDVSATANQPIIRPKILLIDEVDVFFSQEFYGNLYTPSASLKDPTITSLVQYIWTQRKSQLNLRKIRMTPEYGACSTKFPEWMLLIDEAIKDMVADVKSFESHDYVVKKDKIGYIEQDNIVYNVVYGYKTLFAYYHEHEKGNISKESLNESICIRISCGSFSYAEIPIQFEYIMGVTGTLETLTDPEKKVIRNDYKVRKETYAPSVFGQNNLRFKEKDDIMIENSNDYFNRIKREIDDRIVGKNLEKRAILVFFESKAKLMQFYESSALDSIRESVAYLTEDALLEEKEALIARATISGQITLFTRTFGRGTDFKCHDQTVATNGGIHVIQTFLSEECSEEKQIKGRTARQGEEGSYSMILLDQDLEKFLIHRSHIEDVLQGISFRAWLTDSLRLTDTIKTVYGLLHDRRTALFKTQYEENKKYVEQAKEKHEISKKFLSNLRSKKNDEIKKFLIEENRGAIETTKSRTVCLMDATISMTNLLHKCKTTVDTMFKRASEILTDYGMDPQSFQLQFVVYRNYNSTHDKLLQSSPWETEPDNLRSFMSKINVEGGWINEAIEIGLWYANKEHKREPITQVILIGDAPPNNLDEVKMKRDQFGKKYWKETRFREPTYYATELDKLIENGIPVHAFYVETRAKNKFEEIARKTKGKCQSLDINSSIGGDMLADLVTEQILNNVGGAARGQELVNAYRKKFPKSYTST